MALNSIIDIILVLTVLGGTAWGLKKGFVRVIAKPIQLFSSFIVAYFLAKPVGRLIIEPIIFEPITNKLAGYLSGACQGLTAEDASGSIPTLLKFAAVLFDVNVDEVVAGTSGDMLIERLVKALAEPFVVILSTIIAFVVIFCLVRLIVSILLAIVNNVLDKGEPGILNRVLGCAFGALFSFVVAWSLVCLFDFVISLPAFADREWAVNFEGGHVYCFFRNISPMDLLLSF